MEKLNYEDLKKAVRESDSYPEVCIKLGFDPKKGNIKKNIERQVKRMELSTSHFSTIQRLKNKWNKDKIKKLVKTCKTYKEILLELDYLPIYTNYEKLKKLLKEWNIEFKSSLSDKEKWKEENLSNIVKNSFSYRGCLKKLNIRNAGGNFRTLKKYIEKYNIDTSHFKIEQCLGHKKDISEYLVENSNCSRANLKRRLLEENILENICVLCGQDNNWKGTKISLVLDHINGIHNDNRIENLRIVCPNCNAGLDTFAGKNNKIK